MNFARLGSFLLLLAWTRATVLNEVCEEGLENTSLNTNLTLEDLGLQLVVGTAETGSNLTVSSLYPLHIEGQFDEALIIVSGTATNTSHELFVNLEPGHEGRGCDTDTGDQRGVILLDGKPTASYVQLLNSGSVEIEGWVSKDAEVGVARLSFSVVDPTDSETSAFSPIVLESVSYSMPENETNVDDTTPAPSVAPAKVLDLAIGYSSLDSVVLPTNATNEISPTEVQAPSPSPSMAWTFRPTQTHSPTGTSSPSYSTACHICGNPEDVISKPDESVPVLGLLVSCGSLQKWSEDGHISPTTCEQVQGPVQELCGCQGPSAAPSPLLTFPPTSSAYPTVTSSPSYSQTCDLDICPDVGAQKSVNVLGLAVSCQSLLANSKLNLVSPQVCEIVTDLVKEGCTCEPSSAPSSTLEPPTSSPTDPENCEICPGTASGATLIFQGEEYACDEFQSFGFFSRVNPDVCPSLQALVEETCGCAQASMEETTAPSQTSVERSIESSSLRTGYFTALTLVLSSIVLMLL